jgi:adenylosuccinate synthase
LTARQELDYLTGLGISHNNLKISFRARLILPHHILLDMLSESLAEKSKKIGTTGRGVGPVFQDHVARTGLMVMDMLNADTLRAKLAYVLRDKIAFLKTLDPELIKEVMYQERLEKGRFFCPETILNIDAIVARYIEHGEYFRKMICDTESYLKSQLGKKCIVFEGAQGALLDINQGSYPFVTSSRCTTAGLASGAGLHESDITVSLGVVKAYLTRVGEGSFPTEIGGNNAVNTYNQNIRKGLDIAGISLSAQINSSDPIVQGGAIGVVGNEFGATTGRPRRIGWMDLPALRYAIDINGPKIVITKLDILTGIEKLPICVRYRYEGPDNPAIPLARDQELEVMIPEDEILKHCQPIYEKMDGWEEDISGVRSWHDLPPNARKYLYRIVKLTGAKIEMIGVGPGREQTFFV